MERVKQEVEKILNILPDDCSIEDVQYHLYVLQKIERGLKDIEEGKTYSQEEVEARMAKWLKK
jgi:predicted transcriptional regulator